MSLGDVGSDAGWGLIRIDGEMTKMKGSSTYVRGVVKG